jgi:hypothetical protein
MLAVESRTDASPASIGPGKSDGHAAVLVAPGATALFRVYVVLTTANEKGSNTVGVTRPEV